MDEETTILTIFVYFILFISIGIVIVLEVIEPETKACRDLGYENYFSDGVFMNIGVCYNDNNTNYMDGTVKTINVLIVNDGFFKVRAIPYTK